jgi:hypothetical protein
VLPGRGDGLPPRGQVDATPFVLAQQFLAAHWAPCLAGSGAKDGVPRFASRRAAAAALALADGRFRGFRRELKCEHDRALAAKGALCAADKKPTRALSAILDPALKRADLRRCGGTSHRRWFRLRRRCRSERRSQRRDGSGAATSAGGRGRWRRRSAAVAAEIKLHLVVVVDDEIIHATVAAVALLLAEEGDIVKDVRGSESNCEQDSRGM